MTHVACDVLVIGGGVSGVAAALAAARTGAHAILVEQKPWLGGVGYSGKLHHICGLYLNGNEIPSDTLEDGITREIAGLLQSKGPLEKIGKVYVLPYDAEYLQAVLTALCDAEKKLTVMRETSAISLEMTGKKINTVILEASSEQIVVNSRMVIDCSGNGSIAARAGAEIEYASQEERQLAGFIVEVAGLQDTSESLSLMVPYYLARAVEQGIFEQRMKFTTFSKGKNQTEGFFKMSFDQEDEPDRTNSAQKDAVAMLNYLASVCTAFQHATITTTSLDVVDREGGRVVGPYMLTQDDILTARKFPDGVVKNAWPIEIWDRSHGTRYHYVPQGDYYEIPFRCLQVNGVDNLLTAGRCISVSHGALGSTRVMGACMALGDKAGRSAVSFIQKGIFIDKKDA
ncbi:MAG: FAD-dependent oxidoreductase [Nitrospirota bacterium]